MRGAIGAGVLFAAALPRTLREHEEAL